MQQPLNNMCQGKRGNPVLSEQVETDSAILLNVRMVDAGHALDTRRSMVVICRNIERELEFATLETSLCEFQHGREKGLGQTYAIDAFGRAQLHEKVCEAVISARERQRHIHALQCVFGQSAEI
jgi:hypothetical protein